MADRRVEETIVVKQQSAEVDQLIAKLKTLQSELKTTQTAATGGASRSTPAAQTQTAAIKAETAALKADADKRLEIGKSYAQRTQQLKIETDKELEIEKAYALRSREIGAGVAKTQAAIFAELKQSRGQHVREMQRLGREEIRQYESAQAALAQLEHQAASRAAAAASRQFTVRRAQAEAAAVRGVAQPHTLWQRVSGAPGGTLAEARAAGSSARLGVDLVGRGYSQSEIAAIQAAKAETAALTGTLMAAEKAGAGVGSALSGAARSALGFGLAIAGLEGIRGIKTLITELFTFDAQIEQTKLGIAETISVAGQFVDPLGHALPIAQQIKLAFNESEEVVNALVRDSVKLGFNLEAAAQAYTISAGAFKRAKIDLKDSVHITEGLIILAQRLNIPENVRARDVRDILQGSPQLSRTILGQALQLDVKQVQAAIQKNQLADLLNEKLQGVFETSKHNLETFQGIKEAITASARALSQPLSAAAFDVIKREGAGILDSLERLRNSPEEMQRLSDALRGTAEASAIVFHGLEKVGGVLGSIAARIGDIAAARDELSTGERIVAGLIPSTAPFILTRGKERAQARRHVALLEDTQAAQQAAPGLDLLLADAKRNPALMRDADIVREFQAQRDRSKRLAGAALLSRNPEEAARASKAAEELRQRVDAFDKNFSFKETDASISEQIEKAKELGVQLDAKTLQKRFADALRAKDPGKAEQVSAALTTAQRIENEQKVRKALPGAFSPASPTDSKSEIELRALGMSALAKEQKDADDQAQNRAVQIANINKTAGAERQRLLELQRGVEDARYKGDEANLRRTQQADTARVTILREQLSILEAERAPVSDRMLVLQRINEIERGNLGTETNLADLARQRADLVAQRAQAERDAATTPEQWYQAEIKLIDAQREQADAAGKRLEIEDKTTAALGQQAIQLAKMRQGYDGLIASTKDLAHAALFGNVEQFLRQKVQSFIGEQVDTGIDALASAFFGPTQSQQIIAGLGTNASRQQPSSSGGGQSLIGRYQQLKQLDALTGGRVSSALGFGAETAAGLTAADAAAASSAGVTAVGSGAALTAQESALMFPGANGAAEAANFNAAGTGAGAGAGAAAGVAGFIAAAIVVANAANAARKLRLRPGISEGQIQRKAMTAGYESLGLPEPIAKSLVVADSWIPYLGLGNFNRLIGLFNQKTSGSLARREVGKVFQGLQIPQITSNSDSGVGGVGHLNIREFGQRGGPNIPLPADIAALGGTGSGVEFGVNYTKGLGRGSFSPDWIRNAILNNAAALRISAEDADKQIKAFTQSFGGKDINEAILKLQAATLGANSPLAFKPSSDQMKAAVGELVRAYYDLPPAIDAGRIALSLFSDDGRLNIERLKRTAELAKQTVTGGVTGLLDALEKTSSGALAGRTLAEQFGASFFSTLNERLLQRKDIAPLLTKAAIDEEQLTAALASGDRARVRQLTADFQRDFAAGRDTALRIATPITAEARAIARSIGVPVAGGVEGLGLGKLPSFDTPTMTTVPGFSLGTPVLSWTHVGEKIYNPAYHGDMISELRALREEVRSLKASMQPTVIQDQTQHVLVVDGRVLARTEENNGRLQRVGRSMPDPMLSVTR